MATKGKSKATFTNRVKIKGYLKENNLELVSNANGRAVRGSLTIATDELNSHKIQFFVSEFTFTHEPSKNFEGMLNLLPQSTITVASYLKNNPGSDFKTAAAAASRVWAMGKFDEYAVREGEREDSSVSVKGINAGFAKNEAGTEFTPVAEFEIDGYVSGVEEEVIEEDDGKTTTTGRLNMEILIPKYKDSVNKVSFIAVSEDNVASYIKSHYPVGSTGTFRGELVNIYERKLKEGREDTGFGKPSAPQYETKFIHERRILGGGTKPYDAKSELYLSNSMILDYLANRELKMEENGERARNRNAAKEEAEPAPATTFTQGFTSSNDELDF